MVRIMISTDNHLGYLEKDPVRGDDSFRAFEEVLQIAKANKVDMVLLGGDLFHENKPSRRTVVRTMQILRRMCLGYDEVRLAVRSDVAEINYMNENIAVSLPVFIIHGNHDDPTGAAGLDALSALDLLSEANLITYFGKIETAKKIDVAPILLQKGVTKIALYGLGNVRDEVLYDTWARQRKVRWLVPDVDRDSGIGSAQPTERPEEADDEDNEASDENEQPKFVPKNSGSASKWFNLFVLHQNRLTRGSSRGITETLLPPWLDYVVWGHEHDSIPDLLLSKPPIVQPGSTVGTSLSAGEAKQKHAILLEVNEGSMKHTPIPLRTVRNFLFEDIALSDQEGLDPLKPETVKKFLDKKVSEMIESQETLYDIERASLENGTASIDNGGFRYPPHKWYLEQLTHITRQPLVRLRVEITGGWESLNTRRFGQPFVGRCACPDDILLFYKHRRTKTTRPFLSGHVTGKIDDADDDLNAEDYAEDIRQDIEGGVMDDNVQKACQIPKLVQYYLYHRKAGGTGLQFLELDKLSTAVDEFVDKQEVHAIPNYVTKFLKDQQRRTLAEKENNGDPWNEETIMEKFKNQAKEAANRHVLEGEQETETQKENDNSMDVDANDSNSKKEKTSEDMQTELEKRLNSVDELVSQDPRLKKNLAANAARLEDEGDDSEDDYRVKPATKKVGRGRPKAARTTTKRKPTPSTTSRQPVRKQTKIPSQKVVESDDDDDDDDIMDEADWEAEQKRIAAERKPTRTRATRSKTQSVTIEISDDEIQEEDDEDDEYVAPKNTRKRKATKPPAGSSSRSRARTKKDTTSVSGRSSSFASRARNRRATPTINLDDD